MALFLKLEQSSHFNGVCVCVYVYVRVPSIAAFLASSSAFPSQSLSLSLFSINSQIDCMEIIHRTRYRRLQGFFLQVETEQGRPVRLLEREKERDYATRMQRGREKFARSSIDFRLELRQILLRDTSMIPSAGNPCQVLFFS